MYLDNKTENKQIIKLSSPVNFLYITLDKFIRFELFYVKYNTVI